MFYIEDEKLQKTAEIMTEFKVRNSRSWLQNKITSTTPELSIHVVLWLTSTNLEMLVGGEGLGGFKN